MIMQNKKFSQEMASMLARICENNFASVSNEVQKLDAYCDNSVTKRDIDTIVNKTEKYQAYELGNALLKRDVNQANRILENLLSNDMDEYAVFGSLLSFSRRLFYAICSGLTDAELAKFLGVHPYAVTATRRDGKWIGKDRAIQIYERALDLETQIKSGKILAERATVFLVREMS